MNFWLSFPQLGVTPSSSFPTHITLPRRQKDDLYTSEHSWLTHEWMDKVFCVCHAMFWPSMYIKKGASPSQHLHRKQTM